MALSLYSGSVLGLLTKKLITVFILALNLLRCSKAFSLRLKAPRMVKTSGNMIAMLKRVRSMS